MKAKTIIKLVGVSTAAVVVLLLLFKGCGGSGIVSELIKNAIPEPLPVRVDTVTVRDTVRSVRVDSFYQEKIVYLDRVKPARPDTVYITQGDSLNAYGGTVENDTLTITYEAQTRGELTDLRLGYLLKPPALTQRTITETVTVDRTITKELYRNGFYVGSGLRYEPALPLIFTTEAGYVTRNGWYYGYGFEPSTKSHRLTVKRRIF